MLLLVPTEDSAESTSPSQQHVLVILPPRANLGAETMVVPRDRRAGGMATGHYPLLDPLSPAGGRRRHSTQTIPISSSFSSSSSSPFVSNSSKKERRGSHLGVSRSTLRHSLSASSRIFTTYSMSSSPPSLSTIPSAQRSLSMMVDDDSEDDYLYHEAFKSSRTVQSPLLFSGNSEYEEELRLLTNSLNMSATAGGGVTTSSKGERRSSLRLKNGFRSMQIPQEVILETPTPTAIDNRLSKEVESEDEDDEDLEGGSEQQGSKRLIHGAPPSERVQASSFLSLKDKWSNSSLSSSSLSSSPSSYLQVSLMTSSMSSPGLRSPMEDSALTSPTRGRRHVSEDRTPQLTADDISSSLNAHLTPVEIQNRLYQQRERLAWSRGQRRARSTSHRSHHQHHHPNHPHHHRQRRESTAGTSHSQDPSQQLQWPLSNQLSLQHQLLSLALATPSRIGIVHPFDQVSATMPPPPLPSLPQSRYVSTLDGTTPSTTVAGGERMYSFLTPNEEKLHPLQNTCSIDPSAGQFSHIPKLPPSAFRTVESLRMDEEKVRKEQLQQQQRERLQQEQDEINRFLVFPSPTL